MPVSELTKRQVYDRDGGRCVVCHSPRNLERTPHHCLFRSQYFKDDRDQPWNLVNICIQCHRFAHSNRNLRKRLELLAIDRRGK
jgi:5-methylcytosine-specific restriction endonuclease McrA